jgi:hypothetical protein
MKIVNNSKHYVRGHVNSGLPSEEGNRVAVTGDLGPGGDSWSHDVPPGDYYVTIATTNIGPLPPGITIAKSGGVPSGGTVTLTATDRIAVG